jgi:hypothetical protein
MQHHEFASTTGVQAQIGKLNMNRSLPIYFGKMFSLHYLLLNITSAETCIPKTRFTTVPGSIHTTRYAYSLAANNTTHRCLFRAPAKQGHQHGNNKKHIVIYNSSFILIHLYKHDFLAGTLLFVFAVVLHFSACCSYQHQ